jgi:hypothetical protein
MLHVRPENKYPRPPSLQLVTFTRLARVFPSLTLSLFFSSPQFPTFFLYFFLKENFGPMKILAHFLFSAQPLYSSPLPYFFPLSHYYLLQQHDARTSRACAHHRGAPPTNLDASYPSSIPSTSNPGRLKTRTSPQSKSSIARAIANNPPTIKLARLNDLDHQEIPPSGHERVNPKAIISLKILELDASEMVYASCFQTP